MKGTQWDEATRRFMQNFGNTFANGGMQGVLSGQQPNWGMVAAQSFGQSLGQTMGRSLVDKLPKFGIAASAVTPNDLPVSSDSGANSLANVAEQTQAQEQAALQENAKGTGAVPVSMPDEVVVTGHEWTAADEAKYQLSINAASDAARLVSRNDERPVYDRNAPHRTSHD